MIIDDSGDLTHEELLDRAHDQQPDPRRQPPPPVVKAERGMKHER